MEYVIRATGGVCFTFEMTFMFWKILQKILNIPEKLSNNSVISDK